MLWYAQVDTHKDAEVNCGMFVKADAHCLSVWKTVSPFLAIELLVSLYFLYGHLL